MNPQFEAAIELHEYFETRKIPYAIIGGMAVQYWGEPRFTKDIDITILLPQDQESLLLKEILDVFPSRINNALEFALQNRVCLVKSRNGCDIDISLGIPGYEEMVMQRSIPWEIAEGKHCYLCSAEDLIIHKIISYRFQDYYDIEGILIRQGSKLNLEYLREWLNNFANLLDTKEIIERFEALLKHIKELRS
jgi:Nucleotidyl transferase AbiEii toxin, Type IV TA system